MGAVAASLRFSRPVALAIHRHVSLGLSSILSPFYITDPLETTLKEANLVRDFAIVHHLVPKK